MSSTVASAAIARGASSWARVIVMISPYTFSAISIAIAIGISVLGAAWGIYIIGSSLIGAAIQASRITSKNLISFVKNEPIGSLELVPCTNHIGLDLIGIKMSSTVATAAIAGGASSWARAIVMISPYTFSAIGIAIAIGVSVLSAACLIGAAIKAPRIASKNLISFVKNEPIGSLELVPCTNHIGSDLIGIKMSSTVATAAIAGGASSWARAIVMISPYTFSAIGIAIAIGVSEYLNNWKQFDRCCNQSSPDCFQESY
ncbi:V-type proton ATPase subunit c''2 [Fagus crenata]